MKKKKRNNANNKKNENKNKNEKKGKREKKTRKGLSPFGERRSAEDTEKAD